VKKNDSTAPLSLPVFRQISAIAARQDVPAFVVGGYVRDFYLGRPSTDIDVVVVGSSRVYHGANTPLLSELATRALGHPVSVYNFGVPAGDLPGYLLTVEDVLRPGLRRPSLFVFGMSPIE